MRDWHDGVNQVLLSYLKNRNAFADALFYDVCALTESERSQLDPMIEREGSVVVVSPAQARPEGETIRHYPSAREFLESVDHPAQAIVLAGVGSSVLGAAALARNVANVYQMDVAAVVTGYGMLDIMDEALGGWLFYGAADRSRLELDNFLKQFPQMAWGMKLARSTTAGVWNQLSGVVTPGIRDTRTLLEILSQQTGSLRLLLGHSKGSLMIAYALAHASMDGHACFKNVQVVTLGAVADIPGTCVMKRQFIGGLDWFGGMNSRMGVPYTLIPNAWHHTNTKLAYHLSVEEVLKEVHLPSRSVQTP
ncbi:MAG: hypothetical protein HQM01_09115 [Magnetococcales bacterium]|nr:hypothetical protein [Magnetococcales bacterium]